MVFPLTSQFPLQKQAAEGYKDLVLAVAGTGLPAPPAPTALSCPARESGSWVRQEIS